jgi:hypothetical protein
MAERRGAKGVRDLGLRTRGTDLPPTRISPHAIQVWITTFNLRWARHLTELRKKRRSPV